MVYQLSEKKIVVVINKIMKKLKDFWKSTIARKNKEFLEYIKWEKKMDDPEEWKKMKMENKRRNLSDRPFTPAEFTKAVLPFLEKCFRRGGAVGLERGRARVERLKSEYIKKGWIKKN